ncbi:MAG: nuclear transport factor 2 family protein [Sphingomonas sp.]
MSEEIAALSKRIDALEHALGIEQDVNQVRRLQYTYGYFIDKSQYNEVADLFAEDGEVWFLGGIYRGKAGGAPPLYRAVPDAVHRGTTARATAGCSITRSSRW